MKKQKAKFIKTDMTNDYSIFIYPKYQRKINRAKVKYISESILENSFIECVSVRPSKKHSGKYEVYNGQHTIEACKLVSSPVVYNVFENVTNRGMIALNNRSQKWSLPDYLDFGVTDRDPNYLFLKKIHKQENISLTPLIKIYGTNKKDFEALKWKVLNKTNGDILLDIVKDMFYTYNVEHAKLARFIDGLRMVVKSGLYNHKRMMKQLSKCSKKLTKQADPTDYVSNIQYVYNFGLPKKQHVKFVK